jgi:hypothetical protein
MPLLAVDPLEERVRLYVKVHAQFFLGVLTAMRRDAKGFTPKALIVSGLFTLYLEAFQPYVKPGLQATFMHGDDKLLVIRVSRGVFGLKVDIVEKTRSSEHLVELPLWDLPIR